MEEREISLSELFEIIRKRLMLIIALTILGAVIAFGVSSILPKKYETFTTLLVGRPEGYQAEQDLNVNDILFNQKLVGTYAELIKSRSVAKRYHARFGIIPPVDIFHEYFFLFTRIENSDLLNRFDSKLELMNNFEESSDFLRQNPSKFKDFNEFIKFCRLDESE